jgi:hypothetical protein
MTRAAAGVVTGPTTADVERMLDVGALVRDLLGDAALGGKVRALAAAPGLSPADARAVDFFIRKFVADAYATRGVRQPDQAAVSNVVADIRRGLVQADMSSASPVGYARLWPGVAALFS